MLTIQVLNIAISGSGKYAKP